MNAARTLDGFSTALSEAGSEAGLKYLNDGVPHRYTAVYRLRDGVLHNVLLCDKQGEIRPDFLAEVPLETSFCQFVLRDGTFRTTDSGTDPRLDGHPYQGVLISYHGVPLIDAAGRLWGTLCHFDAQALPLSDDEFALLETAARLLPAYLPPG